MSINIYLLTGLIAVVIGGIFAFIDVKISLGIGLATIFSILNMFLLSISMKKVISSEVPSYGLLMASNIIRFTILFAMLFIAYKLPNLFSLIGVAIGLTLFIIALVIDSLKKKGSK